MMLHVKAGRKQNIKNARMEFYSFYSENIPVWIYSRENGESGNEGREEEESKAWEE